jgi:hypothetical protein
MGITSVGIKEQSKLVGVETAWGYLVRYSYVKHKQLLHIIITEHLSIGMISNMQAKVT